MRFLHNSLPEKSHQKIIICAVIYLLIVLIYPFYAEARDWELWTQDLFTVPLTKKISYMILPEWRFNKDMDYNYLFKVETGPSYKINDNFDIAVWYIYQEKQSAGMWDRSDLAYFDVTGKIKLENLFDLDISNRLRYQYDFDKVRTTIRDSLRFSKSFTVAKIEIAPYLQEEPFYDCRLDRIVEHRSAAGFIFTFFKKYSFNIGYMLNSKKPGNKWTYANVLLVNANIRF